VMGREGLRRFGDVHGGMADGVWVSGKLQASELEESRLE
jgi:hypothetical protein